MRHNTFYILFALSAFVMCATFFSSCASAQEKANTTQNEKKSDENAVEESKFQAILANATENLAGKTYRLTKTEEDFSDRDANAERVETNILEIVLPNSRREVQEIKSATENTRLETIWDGKSFYEKRNNGEWEKFSGRGNSGGGNFTSGRTTTTYKFVGKEILDGKSSNVYESESHRIANKMTQTSRYQVEYITKTKYWISEDGLFLKTLKESEVAGSKSLARETQIYEYNPKNLKIEAPIK